MKRNLDALAERRFDVLVIGGGIYGASVARDAALRGLSVALIEKSDFCSGTSHNSLKIIHNGIRYLQHLDFRRVRESINEAKVWLTIAPHLVHPMKVMIPAQGWATRGPLALQSAVLLHRLLSLGRRVPGARIPRGQVYGRSSLRRYIPGLPMDGLSGVASWHDGQVRDVNRVVIECLQSAVANGAQVANYLAAGSLLRTDGKVHGVTAVDQIHGREIEIRATVTVNAGGPWIKKILHQTLGDEVSRNITPLARNMNIVTRQLLPDYAIGVPSNRRSDAVIGSESRLFFITPWKDVSVIGTTHFPFHGDPDGYRVTEQEIEAFLREINESYPPARLSMDDVLYVYSGLTPAEPEAVRGEVGRLKHPEIIDHAGRDGAAGLVSVIGVKFTTSRSVAERTVSLVQEKLGVRVVPNKSRSVPLPGALAAGGGGCNCPARYDDPAITDLLQSYGNKLPGRLRGGVQNLHQAFAACVQQAVDHEMAVDLEDFLLRRNDFAVRGHLTEELLQLTADIMRPRLGWTPAESRAKKERMRRFIRGHAAEHRKRELVRQ